jgi:hypothetical protein
LRATILATFSLWIPGDKKESEVWGAGYSSEWEEPEGLCSPMCRSRIFQDVSDLKWTWAENSAERSGSEYNSESGGDATRKHKIQTFIYIYSLYIPRTEHQVVLFLFRKGSRPRA